jgi:UV DNA damage endonuclease
LCCLFLDADVKFRSATHRYVGALEPVRRREYLAGVARDNAAALLAAVEECRRLGIGAFRINSQILPLSTHPQSGYRLPGIDPDGSIEAAFRAAGQAARAADIRLSFHPDQFVVLNSERQAVVESSLAELDYQAAVAELVGADVIVFHAGSSAGGIEAALDRLERGVERLSERARVRIAIENDDRHFSPADMLPLCHRLGVPLVYDVHHHRCNGDGLTVEEATDRAAETWGPREPYNHISSPRDGWGSANERPHADYIEPSDFPDPWRGRRMTVDVEAKAKERAVIKLMKSVSGIGTNVSGKREIPQSDPAHVSSPPLTPSLPRFTAPPASG